MNANIYINGTVMRLTEDYGHYSFRELFNNEIICTCDPGELNETIAELEKEYSGYMRA